MESQSNYYIDEYEKSKKLMQSQDNYISEMKKILVLKTNDVEKTKSAIVDFDNSIHMSFFSILSNEEGLDEWEIKIERNKAKLHILHDIKNALFEKIGEQNNYKSLYQSNKERLINLYIDQFEFEIEVFVECKKLEQLERNHYRNLRVLEENSVFIGEGSLVTLKFDCDEESNNFLLEGNYYTIEKGKHNYIQSHISKIDCDCEYELLNTASALGRAIRGKRAGDIIKYSNGRETFGVNVISIKYVLKQSYSV